MDNLLIHTCSIYRRTQSGTSPSNNPVYMDTLVGSGVKCRLTSTSGIESETPHKAIPYTYILFTRHSDLNERDKVVIDSVSYEVLSIKRENDMTGFHHIEAGMERIVL